MINKVEKAKRKSAYRAVDEWLKDGQVVGIGSGSTVRYAVERIAERVQQENLKITCVPTSFQAIQLIQNNKLPEGSLAKYPVVDVTFDGADEVVVPVLRHIRREFPNEGIRGEIREAKMKMGPVVTDNGNFIIDIQFDPEKTLTFLKKDNIAETNRKLINIVGIIETGLFVSPQISIQKVYIGLENGEVDVVSSVGFKAKL